MSLLRDAEVGKFSYFTFALKVQNHCNFNTVQTENVFLIEKDLF